MSDGLLLWAVVTLIGTAFLTIGAITNDITFLIASIAMHTIGLAIVLVSYTSPEPGW